MSRSMHFEKWKDTRWVGEGLVLDEVARGQPTAPTAPTEWWSDRGCDCPPPSTVALHAGMELPPMSTGTLRLGATPPDPRAKALADMDENEIISALLYSPTLFQRLFGPLVDDRPMFWAAVGLRRCDLREVPQGLKPGDLDVVIGPMVGREPDFSRLVGIEVKVRRAKQGDVGNVSSYGTTQAKGLLELGCDRAALVQIVVAHQVADAAWIQGSRSLGSLFGMDLTSAVSALAHGTGPHRDARLGYIVAAWGHAAGSEPLASSALVVYPLIRPAPNPRRHWLEWQIASSKLQRALVNYWNVLNPPDHIIRCCYLCHHVVPVPRRRPAACPQCGRAWVRPFALPLPENLRPLDAR